VKVHKFLTLRRAAACPDASLRRNSAVLYLAQRRENIHLAHEVFYTPDIRWKSREGFETSMALRAKPNVSNKLMIHVFGVLGRNQFVAAPDAIHSEQGEWVERHRIP
jgi:hypothetical protein